jgi:hypothetical protein
MILPFPSSPKKPPTATVQDTVDSFSQTNIRISGVY